jgi:phosphoenolpyruvate synthase/pyruvate phosphate dikinase
LIDYSILDLINGKPRKYPRLVTFVSINGEFTFFDRPILHEKYRQQSELKGMVANHGFAQGRAKIVKTAYEIGKVKKGDILFAPTTAPSMILGMKKAAAFVTDEGGITSHAAIVSREMGKPCIIGTKIGTKVFKDGDLIEVDANQGVVRKI